MAIVTIRDMTVDDTDTVYDIGTQVEAFTVHENDSQEDRFRPQHVLEQWARSDDPTLVAEADEIVGFVLARFHEPTGQGDIENIYVAENHRRKRIGSQLLTACLQRLQEQGARYIAAHTHMDNDRAAAFLDRNGFQRGKPFYWMEQYPDS